MSAITRRNDIRFLLQCLRIFNVTPLHAHLSNNHTLRKPVETCSSQYYTLVIGLFSSLGDQSKNQCV